MSLMRCSLCLGSVQSRLALLLDVDFLFYLMVTTTFIIYEVDLTSRFYVICSMSTNYIVGCLSNCGFEHANLSYHSNSKC
jgi:hypothetical protein